jgi:CysZ protein
MFYTNVFSHFIKLLTTKRLYYYLIPGLVVSVIYLGLGFSFGWFDSKPEINPDELGFFKKIWHKLVAGGLWFSKMLYEIIIITLFSPIMAMLSERCDSTLSGRKFDFSVGRFLTELARTIGIVITALLLGWIVLGIWKIFTWVIPFPAWTNLAIVFVIKAFFFGFNFVDYSLERYLISIPKSWRYAFRNPMMMIVIGAFFSAVFAIPYVGVMLAPFVATLLSNAYWYEKETLK